MASLYSAIKVQVILPVLLSGLLLISTTEVTYEVTGVLVNETGLAVNGHRVMLYNEQDIMIAGDRTDGEGRFRLAYKLEPTSSDTQARPDMPTEFALGASYPNPFNPRTTIPFYAPESTHAVITVYNILGQQSFAARPTSVPEAKKSG